MTKSASTSNKPRRQYTPEFRQEALKPAERIGVAAARTLSLYESRLCNWRSKQQNQTTSSERGSAQQISEVGRRIGSNIL